MRVDNCWQTHRIASSSRFRFVLFHPVGWSFAVVRNQGPQIGGVMGRAGTPNGLYPNETGSHSFLSFFLLLSLFAKPAALRSSVLVFRSARLIDILPDLVFTAFYKRFFASPSDMNKTKR